MSVDASSGTQHYRTLFSLDNVFFFQLALARVLVLSGSTRGSGTRLMSPLAPVGRLMLAKHAEKNGLVDLNEIKDSSSRH